MRCVLILLGILTTSLCYNIEIVNGATSFYASAILAEFTPNDAENITNATVTYIENTCDKDNLSKFSVQDSVNPYMSQS